MLSTTSTRSRPMTRQLLPAALLVATLVLGAPTVTDTPVPTVTHTPTDTSVVTTADDGDARRRCVWTGSRWRCWERVWGTAGPE
jgi:hypothetical protein